ncbi:MAG: AMP-binding protein, partial [Chloroflexi bacterium]|nr:AMP-binding protein [Chloroflexota bacterium]
MTVKLDSAHDSAFNPSSLVELLRWRADNQPARRAYTFLEDGDAPERNVTYGELDRQARAIAARLAEAGAKGERALLLYPPGLEFISAFFGCLYAGVAAVPAYPPRLNRPMPRLQAIVADAQATIGLTVTSILSNLERRFENEPDMASLRWLDTGTPPPGAEADWREPGITADTLAFLQYTSGSTNAPKGVVLSHGNLMHNLAVIRHGFQLDSSGRALFWLPSYHDMGLIGGLLEPMYIGGSSVLMSPASFLQRPARWLEAIGRHRATITGAPNFAYQLCVDKVTPGQRAALDLSSLHLAFCGAEPIRRETLDNFAETFAPCGFRREAFYPCYGLAEATLLVSGGNGPGVPRIHTVQRKALAQNRVVEASADDDGAQALVSCGHSLLDQKIVIADPETLTRLAPDEIGEIWLAGRSVAQGYWNRPEETQHTFGARLADTGEGPFLRTGDLGFLRDGELFVTGRLKDLIIIHGRNHYPHDIELTVEQSHPALQPSGGAAFAVEADSQSEQLVIVHELTRQGRNANVGEVTAAIRQAVAENHDLSAHAIVLIKPLSLPKTSSGKIQRHACRAQFLEGSLEVMGEWQASDAGRVASDERRVTSDERRVTSDERRPTNDDTVRDDTRHPSPAPRHPSPAPRRATPVTRPAAEIEDWLKRRIARAVRLEPHEIDVRQPFAYYGMNSLQAVGLAGELEEWLGRSVSITLAYDYPTIEAVANYLAGEDGRQPIGDSRPLSAVYRPPSNEPIAIIGIGCRFPGANGPEAYWRLLCDGVDAVGDVPANRWDGHALYDPDPAARGKMNTRWGGFLNQVDGFDSQFFKISPREAARMDPQQRLLLEVAWEALEDAGQDVERLAGTPTGVFVGISTYDYGQLQLNDLSVNDPYIVTGSALSIAANRLSYIFDFRGPSVAIDTACSSSLVATHLACRSLWSGDADLALAGGVNLILSPTITISFTKAGLMAPDGRCKAFDARADGYVRGEGAGVVVLKPLSRALADGDRIYAVIRGSAVNHDGRTNGLMAPSGPAQEDVLRRAYASAGVSPGRVGYVETHGTGTFLGDSIEAKSLGAVIADDRASGFPCAIGSVKSNFGHLEAAAGIAGLIKVALSLKHRAIPPSLHFQEP